MTSSPLDALEVCGRCCGTIKIEQINPRIRCFITCNEQIRCNFSIPSFLQSFNFCRGVSDTRTVVGRSAQQLWPHSARLVLNGGIAGSESVNKFEYNKGTINPTYWHTESQMPSLRYYSLFKFSLMTYKEAVTISLSEIPWGFGLLTNRFSVSNRTSALQCDLNPLS